MAAVAPDAAEASDELVGVAEAVRALGITDPSSSPLDRRAALDLDSPANEGTSVETVDAGGVPAEWLVPEGADRSRAFLHLHGGAYTGGGLGSHRRFASTLAETAGCPVLLVDYRLAPEDPFPAALDDALASYRWLTGPGRGIDPARLVVSGDSAGGGLSLAALVALRDGGEPLPAGAALLSPWTDLSLSGASHVTEDGLDPMCSTRTLAQSAAAYAGDVTLDDPRVSPLFADLTGLPPLLVHVGEVEVLRDDAVRLAEQAAAVGVDVELLVAPGMIHVWHLFAGLVPESTRDLATVVAWAAARVGRTD